MYEYRVGEPYISGRTRWPESVEYNYRSGGHELRMFLRHPSSNEIRAIRSGDTEFALVIDWPVLLLLYRFGDAIPWSDAPYSWHMVPEHQRTVPAEIATGQSAMLSIILVDADTGIIRVLRAVTLSPHFSRALHEAIAAQSVTRFNQAEFDAKLAELYRGDTRSLLPRATARTAGGR